MKVLLPLPDAPYPPRSGGHWRDWQIANLLVRAGHELHVLMFATADTSAEALAAENLSALASSVTFGGHRSEQPDRTRYRRIARKLSYVCARMPATHPQAFQYDAIGATDRIVRHAAESRVDAVVMRSFWCAAAPRLKALGLLVVADSPDYNSALLRQMVAITPGVQKIGPWANYCGVRRMERSYLPAFDETWIATATEADAMRRELSIDRVIVLPNQLDSTAVPDYSDRPGAPGTILFVANFTYSPNARAAGLLLSQILPVVQRAVPEATVTFVGAGLSPALCARARRAGCAVAGRVDAVDRCYASHALVVLPVAEGGGMLFKAVEALTYGRCVVGLAAALRGVPAEQPPAYASAETPHELALALIALLRNPEQRRALARRARGLAARRLSWCAGDDVLRRSLLAKADASRCSEPASSRA
jgi:glycosyltransferase involved in cell wall biosynthesis